MSKVLVPLAEGCEELEAVTIIDLLRRAEIDVIVASLDDKKTVTASRGVQLVADVTLSEVMADSFDLIVLPGGLPGSDHLANDSRVIELLQKQVKKGAPVGAICAAPKVLLKAGLLANHHATAYPGVFDSLDTREVRVSTDKVVVDGSVITSRGPGTAMDFALALIEFLSGKETRAEVEAGLVRD
ncbi:MAG: DJ-1 family glyoxalase III [bacterium]